MFDTDRITHSTSGNKLRVRESADMRHLCRKRIFITTCLALFFVITGTRKNFMLYSCLRTQFPDSSGMSPVCGLQYLLKPIHATNIDLWNVEGSHSVCRLLGQTAALPHFFCHMFDLTSPLSFHYTPCVLWCVELNKEKIRFQQTRSYIMYFLNSCSSVVGGVRSQRLLPSRPQGRQKIILSLTFSRAGYCLCCREKLCGL